MCKLNPDFECVVVLQNCMAIWKNEAHSSTEKQLMLCDDGDQVAGVQVEGATFIKGEENPDPVKVEKVSFIKEEEEQESIKVEEITVIKEESDPLETGSTEIKNGFAVGHMSACVHCYAQHTDTHICLLRF